MTFWLLNTDESEPPGKDADARMKARSVVAAWGTSYNAETLLNKPECGDQVVYFVDGLGIVAMATFDISSAVPSNDIFHKQKEGEFSRKVVDLIKPRGTAITAAEVFKVTGYTLPARGRALKALGDAKAIEFIQSRFR